MKKFLISAATAMAALAMPTQAAAVSANSNGKVKIYRALTITNNNGLDFGTIVLSGTGPYTATVSVSQAGAITCNANVSCSGTPTAASFTVRGTSNQTVAISLPSSTVTLTGANNAANTLTLNLNAPATATLGPAGPTTGVTFGVGGSITFTNTQADDVYNGTFAVNADYQ